MSLFTAYLTYILKALIDALSTKCAEKKRGKNSHFRYYSFYCRQNSKCRCIAMICTQFFLLRKFPGIDFMKELFMLDSKLYTLGFPRDGTSRDKPGRDVPLSLCPGTKKFPCPVVPLSRDKKVLPVPLSLCPGTRAGANVPGRPGTK